MKDTISPDRLVYGAPVREAGIHATEPLNEVHALALAADTPLIVTDYATAELVKVAANAFRGHQDQFHQLHERDRRCIRGQRHGARWGHRLPAQGHPRVHGPRRRTGSGRLGRLPERVDTINLRKRQRAVAMTVQARGKPVYRSKVAVLGHASSRTPTT